MTSDTIVAALATILTGIILWAMFRPRPVFNEDTMRTAVILHAGFAEAHVTRRGRNFYTLNGFFIYNECVRVNVSFTVTRCYGDSNEDLQDRMVAKAKAMVATKRGLY